MNFHKILNSIVKKHPAAAREGGMVKTFEQHVTKKAKQSHLASGLAASSLILISQFTHRSVLYYVIILTQP